MAAISRLNLKSGPAKIVFGTAIAYTAGPVDIGIDCTTFKVSTDAHGDVQDRAQSYSVVVSTTLASEWKHPNTTGFWPYASTGMGTSIFGAAADVPLLIHGKDGELHTVINAGITRMPSIVLSTHKAMIAGPIEFTGVRKLATDWIAADSLYSVGGSSAFANSDFLGTSLITQTYSAVWTGAGTGFVSGLLTEDGWTIDFEMSVAPIATDDLGVIDLRLTNVGAMARCVPVGPSMAEIMTALNCQGAAVNAGASPGAVCGDLVITGRNTTTKVTLKNAVMKSAGFRFGSTVLRQGEVGFVASRSFTGGAMDALWILQPNV